MNRLWSRVGIRVASVGLLVAGVIGGVYLGKDQDVEAPSSATARSSQVDLVMQADAAELKLLKERHGQHAAARAYERQAEGQAASKAAAEAKAAAVKARTVEKKLIEKKAAAKKAAEAKERAESSSGSDSGSGSGATVPYTGAIPDSCDEYDGNKATGCALMLRAGFKIKQFGCLERLWDRESRWSSKAKNNSSGAYGIPQALPGSKMASAGSDWKTNPATQIKWGLGYIKGRYNSPCGAWSHSERSGWY